MESKTLRREKLKSRISRFLVAVGITALVILIFAGLLFAGMEALKQSEISDCKKWAEQARDYPGFYLVDWQQQQCDHYGIKVIQRDDEVKGITSSTELLSGTEYRAINATIYGYSSTVDQTDDSPFITAMGAPVYFGVIANNCLGFGTTVIIPGFENSFVVQDRMNSRYGCEYFDIWFETRQEAMEWGKKEITIYIFDK